MDLPSGLDCCDVVHYLFCASIFSIGIFFLVALVNKCWSNVFLSFFLFCRSAVDPARGLERCSLSDRLVQLYFSGGVAFFDFGSTRSSAGVDEAVFGKTFGK